MTIQERAEKAVELKNSGRCNCAQAVAAVLADQVEMAPETLHQLTAGFCAGMGTMDATCGALIGANVIAGLKTEGQGTLMVSRSMMNRFKEQSGAVACRDLKTMVDGHPVCPCEDCVRHAVLAYGEAMGN